MTDTEAACVFCRIVEGVEPSQTIHEDDHTIAFLNLAPATRGHTLVVPRAHHRDLADIPPDEAAHVMRATVEVSRRLAGALGARGVNLWHASGETAWQSVFHFHVHVVPRYTDTDLTPPWTEIEVPVESLRGLGAEIRRFRPAPRHLL
ncbi:HIT family protein [Nonomuraea angiospora]|uniref:Histidine triad (HIT) family protein n=1 Tax=Nonomuraea angiospora TaxID=46172 RepID=A0ABR9M3M8_9ACTN|nr:HIT family protein [Nonomuraea angiospora]MBE1587220.1 histidine triad (HIT) family protein [Nonomuraea angiospora]MDX3106734.1 HIT family protein [Nonomuraea angiospora]